MEDLIKSKYPSVFAQLSDENARIDGMKLRTWTLKNKLPSGNFMKMLSQCQDQLESVNAVDNSEAIEIDDTLEESARAPTAIPKKPFEDVFSEDLQQELLWSYQMIHGVFRQASDEDLEHSNLLAEQDASYAKESMKDTQEANDPKCLQVFHFRDVPWFEESAIQDIVHEFLVYCK